MIIPQLEDHYRAYPLVLTAEIDFSTFLYDARIDLASIDNSTPACIIQNSEFTQQTDGVWFMQQSTSKVYAVFDVVTSAFPVGIYDVLLTGKRKTATSYVSPKQTSIIRVK